MYCKCIAVTGIILSRKEVLIVAKCIVNVFFNILKKYPNLVLIVAKCIVNIRVKFPSYFPNLVLIVAKCIVNF